MRTAPPRPLTGRKVLAIALGAFGVILAANLALAWFAVGTFSGLVVDNSYVASQSFDRDRRAQEALGWTLSLRHEDDVLALALTDAEGRAVRPPALEVVVGRPTSARSDRTLALRATPAGFVAEAPLEPGIWTVSVDATAENGAAYRRRERLHVAPAP